MSKDLQPVWIHRSQQFGAVALAQAESIRSGRVDHQFHYASARQSELWLAVHCAHSPAVGDPGVEKIYRDIFRRVAAAWKDRSVHVIGMGSGGGHKDVLLLEALGEAGARTRFSPVDVSTTLALISAAATGEFCDEPGRAIVADLLHFPNLPAALAEYDAGEPRLFTFFGMMPNFEPKAILPLLRGWVRAEDQLLLSANLAPAKDESDAAYRAGMEVVRPQYDNCETREWLTRVLFDWGMETLAANYELRVEEVDGLQRFIATVEGLRLFFSYRYTPERLRATLARYGLTLGSGEMSASGQEGVWSAG